MKYIADSVTLIFDAEACTGCRRCIEVCPHGVFEAAGKKIAVTDRNRCMECGACAMNCPAGAVRVDSGVGCAFAIIRGMITGGPPSCDCSDSSDATGSCC